MKKSIIIVTVIGLFILGVLIWGTQMSSPGGTLDKTTDSLQAVKTANMEKLKDAVLKSAILDLALMVDDYYQKNEGKTFFEKEGNNINQVNNYLATIKNERGIEIEYSIHSTNTNYVIKTRIKNANSFYCLDTVSQSVEPKIIESVSNFTSVADCSGTGLK